MTQYYLREHITRLMNSGVRMLFIEICAALLLNPPLEKKIYV